MQRFKNPENPNLNSLINELEVKLGQNTLEYIEPQTHLLKGWPRNEIPAFTKTVKADQVIMGTVARIGIPGFFIGKNNTLMQVKLVYKHSSDQLSTPILPLYYFRKKLYLIVIYRFNAFF